ELAEIKNAILRQPGVRDAVVVCNSASARFDVPRLDAYVVGHGADLSALRSALARFLPEYMMPATFTELAKVPMTSNGKVDYSELPEPKISQLSESANLGPLNLDSSLYAGKIKEAWCSVLGAEPSIDDSFFLIGGNSLAAIHFCAELKKL